MTILQTRNISSLDYELNFVLAHIYKLVSNEITLEPTGHRLKYSRNVQDKDILLTHVYPLYTKRSLEPAQKIESMIS